MSEKMTIPEAVLIIKEFDDSINWAKNVPVLELIKAYCSLDLLVPVWEKLGFEYMPTFESLKGLYGCTFYPNVPKKPIYYFAKTIQEAACVATALSIKAL